MQSRFARKIGMAACGLGFGLLAACGGDDAKPRVDAAVDKIPLADSSLLKDAPVADAPVVDGRVGDASVVDAPAVDAPLGSDVQGDGATGGEAGDAVPGTDGVAPDTKPATDVAAAGDGGAGTACSSLVNPLYIMTGDTQVAVVKALGKALRQSAKPITLVWYATGSCTIIDALYNGTPLKQVPSYIPDDPNWNPDTGAVPSCALESAGHAVDIGIPIVFPEACTTNTPPADLVAFKGPVQSMLFVVPRSASAEGISVAQARAVFGTGATAGIAPWTDENFYFVRPASKGTQVSLGALIGVPAAQWHGQQINLSPDVATKVASSTAPEKTIGILGSEIFDSASNRANLKTLYLQATGQTGGYLPDSSATAFDKRSVREGHYVAWAHVFYLAKAAGVPAVATNPSAKLFIDILTNTPNSATPTGLDTVELVAQKGLVPVCAMTVTRNVEGGNLSPFTPADPCGCYYEGKTGTVSTLCKACVTDATCATGTTCHRGYCEAADGRTSLGECQPLPATPTHAQIINNACTAGTRAIGDPIP